MQVLRQTFPLCTHWNDKAGGPAFLQRFPNGYVLYNLKRKICRKYYITTKYDICPAFFVKLMQCPQQEGRNKTKKRFGVETEPYKLCHQK